MGHEDQVYRHPGASHLTVQQHHPLLQEQTLCHRHPIACGMPYHLQELTERQSRWLSVRAGREIPAYERAKVDSSCQVSCGVNLFRLPLKGVPSRGERRVRVTIIAGPLGIDNVAS